ncbi:sulfite exporter TauE/SafE family protein [Sphingobium sp. AS12]|uniref:sulfite exporter TauE/SafE family protein n=1 Tax=Sphingobium sp. AS12 TaxID=2849495 RepID=UPI001C315BFB|nr:sulfite exporter TauE/SafE family protein [Sphingobium sp. AS12]MBV2149731.1 sulfite exporter TauE/SafE family protein [Sphingobium sp. AS12]
MSYVEPLSGFLVGTMVGLTGVGGGSLMAPIMILLLGIAPATAVGTDLWFAAITKMVGGAVHQHHGNPDWRVVKLLATGSIPASVLMLIFLWGAESHQIKGGLIVHFLGILLILTAIATLMRKQVHKHARTMRTETAKTFKLWQPGLTVFAGAILGLLVTLTSVGAGALGATMLILLYPLRMNARKVVGTDIIHAVPLTIVAGVGHFFIGNVDFNLLLPLLVGSIPGIIIGARLTKHVQGNYLRLALAFMLLFTGIRLMF